MRIFFSVGEPSGDLHGSNLIQRLKSQDPSLEFVGYGGPKMQAAGCELHFELTTMAVMFLEALKSIRFFFKLVGQADEYFKTNQVDAVVLIDYPGFNWWIARKAKKHNIPVFYYGIPQVWAWAPWRVRKIRKLVDHVICKLPFEVEWFAKRKCHATYVGHPYFDQLESQKYDEAFVAKVSGTQTQSSAGASSVSSAESNSSQRLLTLLPGSRDQEVRNVLPILIDSVKLILEETKDCKVAIASYNQRQQEMSQKILNEAIESDIVSSNGQPGISPLSKIEIYVGKTPELMKAAHVCIACSGSVSMELLHHRKPTVIVFKVKRWVMFVQSFMLITKFITLVNLIAAKDIRKRTWRPYCPDRDEPSYAESKQGDDRPRAVMPEYLTSGNPSKKVASRIQILLNDEEVYQAKKEEMNSLAIKYAKSGATNRAADYILTELKKLPQSKRLAETLSTSNAGQKDTSERRAA
ncbi:MAG: lipid-A-disaccharide synthase [Mariniblastus sp.]